LGSAYGFWVALESIFADQKVRWQEKTVAYDKKMRVPLHRVWTAGVSSWNGPGTGTLTDDDQG
jgi:hypothetical protein